MNTQKILPEVEKLHNTAIRFSQADIAGKRYNLEFNGRNYVCSHTDGTVIVEFNTRKVGQAKKWLREYLAN